MKKTLKKIGILVVNILSSHFCYGGQASHQNFSAQKVLSLNKGILKSDKLYAIHQMFAMGNLFNLKIYHYGLQRLNAQYMIPTEQDLLKQIRTHCSFIGRISQNQPHPSNAPFAIFEGEKGHFYLAFQGNIRHFTVNCYAKQRTLLSWIDNGADGYYPFLETFIRCTLS